MMTAIAIELPTESDTTQCAAQIADFIHPPLLIGFTGDLGMGKTTFIRAMLQALGVKERIKSPTFSLLETYTLPAMTIHHLDCYRLTDPRDFIQLGFETYLNDDTLCCIEWPSLAGNHLPTLDVMFALTLHHQGRHLDCEAHTEKGDKLLYEWTKAS